MKGKVIRNHGKRARLGSHGFKLYKNTKIYIGEATDNKQGVQPEILETIKNLWNNDPSIKKIKKHVKHISIRFAPSTKFAGIWHNGKQKFTYNSASHHTPSDAEEIVYHEIIGHAFWHWAKKWRNELWYEFNKLANKTLPINDYVGSYNRRRSDENNSSIYVEEQHSAITELVMHGSSYHPRKKEVASEKDIEKLKKLWRALHY